MMTSSNEISHPNADNVDDFRFNSYLNTSTSADTLFRLSTRWFMWRMETMALVAITLTSVFCVGFKVNRRIEVFCFTTHYFISFQSFVSPAVAGLVMINVFQAAVAVPFVMQLKAAFLAYINSLERNFQYTCLPQEAPARVEEGGVRQSWPEQGSIRMEAVSFRYRPELPLVLRSVSVKIGECCREHILELKGI